MRQYPYQSYAQCKMVLKQPSDCTVVHKMWWCVDQLFFFFLINQYF
jgi:hypothetical protein